MCRIQKSEISEGSDQSTSVHTVTTPGQVISNNSSQSRLACSLRLIRTEVLVWQYVATCQNCKSHHIPVCVPKLDMLFLVTLQHRSTGTEIFSIQCCSMPWILFFAQFCSQTGSYPRWFFSLTSCVLTWSKQVKKYYSAWFFTCQKPFFLSLENLFCDQKKLKKKVIRNAF